MLNLLTLFYIIEIYIELVNIILNYVELVNIN